MKYLKFIIVSMLFYIFIEVLFPYLTPLKKDFILGLITIVAAITMNVKQITLINKANLTRKIIASIIMIILLVICLTPLDIYIIKYGFAIPDTSHKYVEVMRYLYIYILSVLLMRELSET